LLLLSSKSDIFLDRAHAPIISGCAGTSNRIDNGSCHLRRHKPTRRENPLPDTKPTALLPPLPHDMRAGKGQFAKAVGAFVPKVTAAVFQKFGFHSAEILSSWETIVGPELSRLARPQSIKWPRGSASQAEDGETAGQRAGATLIVATDPAFALDVSYRHKEIIERINRYFGYRAIGQIKVYQVPLPETSAAPPTATGTSKQHTMMGSGDLMAALESLGKSVTAAATR
jgi:hypothetical protein